MNILVVSFYAPPANNIAADRLLGYLNYFPKNGINVYAIGRYFDPTFYNDQNMHISLSEAGIDSDFIREENIYYTNFTAKNELASFSAKLPPGIRGLYNLYKTDVFHHGWKKYFYAALEDLLQKTKIDYVMLSYGPPVVLKLAAELSTKYRLKCLVEFRDAYIDEKDKGIKKFLKKRNLNKSCVHAAGFIFAAGGIKDMFLKNASPVLKQKPMFVLPHGFDPGQRVPEENIVGPDREILKTFESFRQKKKAVAIFPGTLYEGQDLEFFMDAMKELNRNSPGTLGICLLGAYFNNRSAVLPDEDVLILPKVAKSTSLLLLSKNDILLLPVWKGRYSGFSGKVSEYCALNRLIAVSPDPQRDLKDFLSDNPNVHLFSQTNEFVNFVGDVVSKKVQPVEQDIQKYSRDYLVGSLSHFIRKLKA